MQLLEKYFLDSWESFHLMGGQRGTSVSGDTQTSAGQGHSNMIYLDLLSAGGYSRDLQQFLPTQVILYFYTATTGQQQRTNRDVIFPNIAVLCDLFISDKL